MSDMGISVTYSGLTTAADGIGTSARHIADHLADVQRHVRRVVETWDGQAKEAYAPKQAEWDKHAAHLHQTLLSVEKAVREAAEHYHHTDKRNAARWQ
jgi:6 kDa early secretory antigenic target